MHKSVLLDSSFFIRFLKENDPFFHHALDYYKYFLENDFALVISTISISEYCVKGTISDLPLKDLQVLPFNIDHAIRAGEFAGYIFESKGTIPVSDRKIIPNDTNLFAQADTDQHITFYLSSDMESKKIFDLLHEKFNMSFQFISLTNPYTVTFSLLDLRS
ncbi:MAG: PIN domain-containing protein [Bacteroidales bacterium]|nr:PIN domain-containing protein [Bacteroidales bacterium]